MKVLSAKDYGYRKVVRVLMNDPAPPIVHMDGTKHSGALPKTLADILSPKSIDVVMNGYQPATKAVKAVAATDTSPAVDAISARPEVKTEKQIVYEAKLKELIARKASPLEWCIQCIDTQNVFEAQFDGDALTKENSAGAMIKRSDKEIVTEALKMAEASVSDAPREMAIN